MFERQVKIPTVQYILEVFNKAPAQAGSVLKPRAFRITVGILKPVKVATETPFT